MTSTTPRAPRTEPPASQIRYSEGFPAEHRPFVEKSIESMIERSSAATARRRHRTDRDLAGALRPADPPGTTGSRHGGHAASAEETPVPLDEDLAHLRRTNSHGTPETMAKLDIRAVSFTAAVGVVR